MDAAAYRTVLCWNTNRTRQEICWWHYDCVYKLHILRCTATDNSCDVLKQGRPVPTNTSSSTLDCRCCPTSFCQNTVSLSFLHSLSLMTSVINNTNATCVNISRTFVTVGTCLMAVSVPVLTVLTASAIQRSAPRGVIKLAKCK